MDRTSAGFAAESTAGFGWRTDRLSIDHGETAADAQRLAGKVVGSRARDEQDDQVAAIDLQIPAQHYG
jgi:hypothetical protein